MMQMFAVGLVMAVSPVAAVGWQSSDTSRPAVSQVRAAHERTVTLTGLVEWHDRGDGYGCLVLRVKKRTFELVGIQRWTGYPGTTQTMRGHIRRHTVTPCHVGPVFEVTEVLPS